MGRARVRCLFWRGTMFKGFLGGSIAGAIGAAGWAALAYFASIEIGWLAWGVGFLVGIGVAAGIGGEGSRQAGILAAIIAVLSVATGKYAAVQMMLPDADELLATSVAALDNTELLVSYVADDVVEEFERAGKTVAWPDGVDPWGAAEETDYPIDVWSVAEGRWNRMSLDQRSEYKSNIQAAIEMSAGEFRELIGQAGFLASFGLLDLIFFGLAVMTAFKIAAGATPDEEETEMVSAEA